jgi:hypothetical protein
MRSSPRQAVQGLVFCSAALFAAPACLSSSASPAKVAARSPAPARPRASAARALAPRTNLVASKALAPPSGGAKTNAPRPLVPLELPPGLGLDGLAWPEVTKVLSQWRGERPIPEWRAQAKTSSTGDSRFVTLIVKFDDASAAAEITARWSAPQVTQYSGRCYWTWRRPSDRIRIQSELVQGQNEHGACAELFPRLTRFTYQEYTPIERVLPTQEGRFGFEFGDGLLGLPWSKVLRHLSEQPGRSVPAGVYETFELPPIEDAVYPAHVVLGYDEGKVTSFALTSEHSLEGLSAALIEERAAAAWGPKEPSSTSERAVYKGPHGRVEVDPEWAHLSSKIGWNPPPDPAEDCHTGGWRLTKVDQAAKERALAARRAEHPQARITFTTFPNSPTPMIREELAEQGLCQISYFGLHAHADICAGIVYEAIDRHTPVPCRPVPDEPPEESQLRTALSFVDALSLRDRSKLARFIAAEGALALILEYDYHEGQDIPNESLRITKQSPPAAWRAFFQEAPGWVGTDTLFAPHQDEQGRTCFTFGGGGTWITITLSADSRHVDQVTVNRH